MHPPRPKTEVSAVSENTSEAQREESVRMTHFAVPARVDALHTYRNTAPSSHARRSQLVPDGRPGVVPTCQNPPLFGLSVELQAMNEERLKECRGW